MDADVTEESLGRLVRAFYAKVRRDPEIGPLFEAAVDDWDEHLEKLTAFWSSVMLASGRFKGRPMQAHMGQPIRPEMFGRWLALWDETTAEMFAPRAAAALQAKAHTIGQSLQLGLFYRPEAVTPG